MENTSSTQIIFFSQVLFGVYKEFEYWKSASSVYTYTNHKKYIHDPTKRINSYDITIIELAERVHIDPFHQTNRAKPEYRPACLALKSDVTTFDNKNAWVYGKNKRFNRF